MVRTHKNLGKHELIGCRVEVLKSTDQNKVGIKGKVVGETKNTLLILVNQTEKILPKAECVFRFTYNDPQSSSVVINGEKLVAIPEERIKQKQTQ